MKNYQQMESEKTKFLIANEKQKVTEKESETLRKRDIILAESQAEVSKINKAREINEQKAKKKIEEVESNLNSFIINIRLHIFRKTEDVNRCRIL